MPSNQTFSEDNQLVPSDSVTMLQTSKGKIIIVIGGRGNSCPKVLIFAFSLNAFVLIANLPFNGNQ